MSDHDAIAAAVAAAYEHAAKVCDELSASYLRSGVGYDESTREGGKVCAANSCANAIRALIPKPTPQPVLPLGHKFVAGIRPNDPQCYEMTFPGRFCKHPRSAHTAAESPRLQEIHPPTPTGFGSKSGRMFVEAPPHISAESPGEVETLRPSKPEQSVKQTPPPSATRDEERERLLSAKRGYWDSHCRHEQLTAYCMTCLREMADAMSAAIEADGKRIAELEGEAAEQKKIADLAVAQCDEMTAEACRMASEIANLPVATAPDGHVLLSRRQPTAEDIEIAKEFVRRMDSDAEASARMASEADEDGTGSQLEEKK